MIHLIVSYCLGTKKNVPDQQKIQNNICSWLIRYNYIVGIVAATDRETGIRPFGDPTTVMIIENGEHALL